MTEQLASHTVDYLVEDVVSWLREADPALFESLHSSFRQASNEVEVDRAYYTTLASEYLSKIQEIIDKAAEVAGKTNGLDSPYYDYALQVVHRWIAFTAYYRLRVRFPSIAPDNRNNSAIELKECNYPQIKGVVIKTAMQKTCTVLVERIIKDPVTGKRVRRSKKYLVHDEYGHCRVGDLVIARSTPRISKRKSHSLLTILNRPGSRPGARVTPIHDQLALVPEGS